MKSEPRLSAAADYDAQELEYPMGGDAVGRKLIRVGIPPRHAGITAALRRAFAQAAAEPSDRDFHELLRKLS